VLFRSDYVILEREGREAAALCAQGEEQRQQGIPPHWLSYVSVKDADAASAKAKELGGRLLMGPFDVMEAGRMALLQDPAGAVFALWQARNHTGIAAYREPDALCWTELATTDATKAGPFYTRLFGWILKPSANPAMPYSEWILGGEPFGGMMEISEHWGPTWKEIPSHWMVYFGVEDVDERAAKAVALGATLCVPPQDIPDVGRFAVINDPQGAVFSIFQAKC
jgi:predicted enzyme related to lactoylglutathione lyase